MSKKIAFLGILLLGLVACQSPPAKKLSDISRLVPGTKLSGPLSLGYGSQQIALPEGEFDVLGVFYLYTEDRPERFRVILAQVFEQRLSKLVSIFTDVDFEIVHNMHMIEYWTPVLTDVYRVPGCIYGHNHHSEIRKWRTSEALRVWDSNPPTSEEGLGDGVLYECSWLSNQSFTETTFTLKDHWKIVRGWLDERNLKIPHHYMISGHFFRADNTRFEDMHFSDNSISREMVLEVYNAIDDNTADLKFPAQGRSPWNHSVIKNDIDKMPYINEMKAWTSRFHEDARERFGG